MRFFVYILILSLSLPFLNKTVVLTNYFLNYQYYALELCENKDNLDLKCNGKCALMKDIKSVEVKTDDLNPPEAPNNMVELVFIDDLSKLKVDNSYNEENSISAFYLNNYSYLFSKKSQKPPEYFG